MVQNITSLGIIGVEFENTIRLNTEVIVGGRGSQARGYGKSFNLAPRSNNKADGGTASGDTAFSGFIASAICCATHPVDGEIISLLKRGGDAQRRGEAFIVSCCVRLDNSQRCIRL